MFSLLQSHAIVANVFLPKETMSYTTLDYLPDLTYSQMAAASWLNFYSYSVPSNGWDYRAQVYGSESYALLHDTYKIIAIAGATYDLFSTSYLDPYLLRIYDQYGNTIVANDEADDGAGVLLSDGYYSQDVIFNWVAPYSGTFYVAASWNQGAYPTYYDLQIYEDVDTAIPVDNIAPYAVSVTPADEATGVAVNANIVFTFSETVQRGSGTVYLKNGSGAVLATYDVATSPNIAISYNIVTLNPTFDLAPGTLYRLESSFGAIKDLAGNSTAASTSYNFTTAAASPIFGTSGNDSLQGTSGNDVIDGLGGTDSVLYANTLANYSIIKTGAGYQVSGIQGTDALSNVERIVFSDKTINLQIQAQAKAAPAADVARLSELYVAFFNRVPDADGLSYWIGQKVAGQSISQIADSFYNAGVQFASLTGFAAGFTNAQFVNVI